jgi:hypothetical protein
VRPEAWTERRSYRQEPDEVRRIAVDFLIFLGFLIAWFALQRFVLPGLGVPT